jgi:hypothetical protein
MFMIIEDKFVQDNFELGAKGARAINRALVDVANLEVGV